MIKGCHQTYRQEKRGAMKTQPRFFRDEDGSVLIVALTMLVLLTLLGFFVAEIAEVEIQVAGNDRLYKENLYGAEAGALECAQWMQETPKLDPGALSWLTPLASKPTINQIRTNSYWIDTNSQQSATDSTIRFMAVEEGVASETSLDMTKTTLYSYSIYGRRYNAGAPQRGRSIMELGFRKAG
jgi:Tfp pilus assembly protein PilX